MNAGAPSSRVLIHLPSGLDPQARSRMLELGGALHRSGRVVEMIGGGIVDDATDVLPVAGLRTLKAGSPQEDLVAYWHELIRLLEEKAPCLYLASPEIEAGWIYPRLSDRILIAPVLHADDRESYEHCSRLGSYCNAVVALDASLRYRIISDFPRLASRVVTFADIRGGEPGSAAEWGNETAKTCSDLETELRRRVESGVYRRRRGRISAFSGGPGARMTETQARAAAKAVNTISLWPDPVSSGKHFSPKPTSSSEQKSLADYRIVVGVTSGRISGVDVFSMSLVNELVRRGYRAEILRTLAEENTADPMPLEGGVRIVDLPLPPYPTWRQRWAALKSYLESEPTIYFPNYDDRHSAVVPILAPHVRVIGIAHSDDPRHYEHIARLAPYWDFVVAVSETIATHLRSLIPGVDDRLAVIPYGVHVFEPPRSPDRRQPPGLRGIYTGRLVQYQKRVFDLVAIADAIRDRGLPIEITVAGNGTDSASFLQAAAPHLLNRTLRFVGSLPNASVLELLRESDVFLLPSRFEGLPVSLLEAMASGCVPIVTAIRSGIPELIEDGQNGFIVPVGAPDRMADVLEQLHSDDALRIRMSGAARETVRSRFSVETMAARYMAVLEDVVALGSVRPPGKLDPPPQLRGIPAMVPAFPLPLRRKVSAVLARIGSDAVIR